MWDNALLYILAKSLANQFQNTEAMLICAKLDNLLSIKMAFSCQYV